MATIEPAAGDHVSPIKRRARRFIALPVEGWLYPEEKLPTDHWRKIDDRYLLMPDPRSVNFSRELIIGYKSGPPDAYDEYGRRPGQPGFNDNAHADREWRTFHAFKGEYARLFGPRRRGRTLQFNQLDKEEDTPDFHAYHLGLEKKHLPSHFKRHGDRRASERSG